MSPEYYSCSSYSGFVLKNELQFFHHMYFSCPSPFFILCPIQLHPGKVFKKNLMFMLFFSNIKIKLNSMTALWIYLLFYSFLTISVTSQKIYFHFPIFLLLIHLKHFFQHYIKTAKSSSNYFFWFFSKSFFEVYFSSKSLERFSPFLFSFILNRAIIYSQRKKSPFPHFKPFLSEG